MSDYAIAHLDEIDEMDDGRCPWRPVRHHLGITAFGVNAWTGHNAGDRIINEHDEEEAGNEELYLVQRGRAVFELDGDRVVAPAGTLVFARPGVKRTAFAEEPETTIIALGGVAGKAYERDGWELWGPLRPLYEAGEYAEAADRGRKVLEADPRMSGCSTTSPAARASRRTRRSDTSGARSKSRSVQSPTRRTIRISIRSATTPRSRS